MIKVSFIGFKPIQETTGVVSDVSMLQVGAGENWTALIKYCLENNLVGLENLTLIPGSVGASPIQNIGAYGVEVCDSINSVEVFNFEDKKFETLSNAQCLFSYRNSVFKQKPNKYLILSVIFSFEKGASLYKRVRVET